jgi:hypothetical protein
LINLFIFFFARPASFAATVNLDERLRLNSCLDDYKLQEVVLVPLVGKISTTLLTPAVSVSDLSSSSSSSNSMNRKSASVTVSHSSKMSSSKSTLKPTTSEATLVGHHEKKKRGLLGLLGFGKHKKGSVSSHFLLLLLFFYLWNFLFISFGDFVSFCQVVQLSVARLDFPFYGDSQSVERV